MLKIKKMEPAAWDWKSLEFDYYKTDCNVRCAYTAAAGAWGGLTVSEDEYIPIHVSASCLHYGTELFEGLKAFRGIDGRVRLFRIEESVERLQSSARRLCLPVPPRELIVEAYTEVVRRNWRHIPPYGTDAALYLRPLEIGTTPGLGVKAAKDALFVVFCSPVGPYFKEGIRPIDVAIDREQDRAAPRGTGDVKIAANYAASIFSGEHAHELGYASVIYLDAVEHRYIEECGAANFFAIRDGKYITPKSSSILPSITNRSLRTLAEEMGLTVEERPVAVEELDGFEECGACGTGAVISPIGRIFDMQTGHTIEYGHEVGKMSLALYNRLKDIQYGRAEDRYGWCTVIDEP